MKKLLTLLILCLAIGVKAQVFSNPSPCGTWQPDSGKLTEWESVDTLKKPVITNERNWVEDEMQPEVKQFQNAVYCPCGCGDPYIKYQYRVCSITGIRQKRYFIINFHYVGREKSTYEKTVDKFHKQ